MSRNKPTHKKNHHHNQKKSQTPLIVMGIMLAVLAVWIASAVVGSSPPEPAPLAEQRGGTQIVSLDLSPAGYSPNNITVKKGLPVEIRTNATADAGCVRGLMIPDFDINKALDVGQDSFTFVPDKAGTFEFTCQMRMSSGTLTVI